MALSELRNESLEELSVILMVDEELIATHIDVTVNTLVKLNVVDLRIICKSSY